MWLQVAVITVLCAGPSIDTAGCDGSVHGLDFYTKKQCTTASPGEHNLCSDKDEQAASWASQHGIQSAGAATCQSLLDSWGGGTGTCATTLGDIPCREMVCLTDFGSICPMSCNLCPEGKLSQLCSPLLLLGCRTIIVCANRITPPPKQPDSGPLSVGCFAVSWPCVRFEPWVISLCPCPIAHLQVSGQGRAVMRLSMMQKVCSTEGASQKQSLAGLVRSGTATPQILTVKSSKHMRRLAKITLMRAWRGTTTVEIQLD